MEFWYCYLTSYSSASIFFQPWRTHRKKNFRSILRPVNEDTSGGTQKRPLAFFFRTVRKQKQNNYYYIHFFPTILILSCRKIAEDDCISGAFYTILWRLEKKDISWGRKGHDWGHGIAFRKNQQYDWQYISYFYYY